MAIPKVMGTEIEYGITVRGDPDFDPISSCVLLVNAYREDRTGEILWDYDQENPLADARGFQVDGEKYTPNQQENIARNKTLVNGARYYVDHAHPEYSCPEVTNARDLVIHEKAGERIIEMSRREADALLPQGAQMLGDAMGRPGAGAAQARHDLLHHPGRAAPGELHLHLAEAARHASPFQHRHSETTNAIPA